MSGCIRGGQGRLPPGRDNWAEAQRMTGVGQADGEWGWIARAGTNQ